MEVHMATLSTIDLVLDREILGPYSEGVAKAVHRGIDVTGEKMKKESIDLAPTTENKWPDFPKARPSGTFKRHIAGRRSGVGFGHSYKWYVKSPEYRLTHLLSNGHQLFIFGRNAHKRTKPDPFISKPFDKACAELVPNVRRELPK